MPKQLFFVLLFALFAFSGCGERVPPGGDIKPAAMIELPQTRQATDYTCGVAVLQSLLYYNGMEYREDVLAKRVGADPELGVNPEAMLACLREHGIGSEFVENMTLAELCAHIDAGRPVVCVLQAWNDEPGYDYSNSWEDGHYAIAIGHDAANMYFMDPSTIANYTYIRKERFLARWHDGDMRRKIFNAGIVVTNPHPQYKRNAFLPLG